MKKRSLICKIKDALPSGKICSWLAVAALGLTLASCAQDGYDDDEKWQSSVTNSQLETPSEDDVVITASEDETKTIITWPVVHGAGGYLCTLQDVSDPENPVFIEDYNEKLIDGCSLTITREEDVKYRFSIRTAGNEKLNNTEAETTTTKDFSTFTPTYTTIPAGVDLYQWFQENPIPAGEEADAIKAELYADMGIAPEDITNQLLNYDLEPGGDYTLSQPLDFLDNKVALRSSKKTNNANLKILGDATCFNTYASLSLKYLNIDCSETNKGLVELSKTPDEAIKGATGVGDYYNIIGTVMLSGCNINGVNGVLITDNGLKYCLRTFMINNCVVHLTSNSATTIQDRAFVYFNYGYVNDLTVQNSTFWNTGETNAKYFVRYQNTGRPDRAGYEKGSVSFISSTFYNVAKTGQWANYDGIVAFKGSTFTMTDCIFADCAKEIARRFIKNYSTNPTYRFGNNTYLYDMAAGAFDDNAANYDKSGTIITSIPDFSDPANGDFTLTSSEQAEKRTGDPRWLP